MQPDGAERSPCLKKSSIVKDLSMVWIIPGMSLLNTII